MMPLRRNDRTHEILAHQEYDILHTYLKEFRQDQTRGQCYAEFLCHPE